MRRSHVGHVDVVAQVGSVSVDHGSHAAVQSSDERRDRPLAVFARAEHGRDAQ